MTGECEQVSWRIVNAVEVPETKNNNNNYELENWTQGY